MLFRFAEDDLNKWFKKKRRKPLVLRGARQVGKSTLVRQFALKHGLLLNEINLERHMDMDSIFKTLDIGHIIREIEAVVGNNLRKPDSLLFLDEIQATPHALQALRYFYEETPGIPLIAAGSLLEFTLSDHHFSMPVGRVDYYHLGPMTFREFLFALEPALDKYISEYELHGEIPVSAHKKLLKKQREYFFTGGMPEAVLTYIETRSIMDVTDTHKSVSETYQDDFAKYAKQRELALMQRVFRHIPRLMGKKIKYSNISREHRSAEVKAVIELLAKARVCHKVCHSHCSGVPLYAELNENTYKLIFMDIGMANHICGTDWISIQSFAERDLVNEGAMAEQFVGQHLIQLKKEAPQLCYWIREGKSANAEVDYVVSQGRVIAPVEVKAGKSGSLKSLHQFVLKKKAKLAIRFDLNPPCLHHVRHVAGAKDGVRPIEFDLLSLPLYMVGELPRLIDQIRIESGIG